MFTHSEALSGWGRQPTVNRKWFQSGHQTSSKTRSSHKRDELAQSQRIEERSLDVKIALPFREQHQPHSSTRPAALTLPPAPRPSPNTSRLTISSTSSAIAKDDVKPGDSMPSRLMKPGAGWLMSKSAEGSPGPTSFGLMPESASDSLSESAY